MKRLGKCCIDCGSEIVDASVVEIKPLYRKNVLTFACGAVMTSTHTANGNIGKVSHAGCTMEVGYTQPLM